MRLCKKFEYSRDKFSQKTNIRELKAKYLYLIAILSLKPGDQSSKYIFKLKVQEHVVFKMIKTANINMLINCNFAKSEMKTFLSKFF